MITEFDKAEEDVQSFGVAVITCDNNPSYKSDDDNTDLGGPGKRNSKTERKAKYMRTEGRGHMCYIDIVNDFNTHVFKQLTGFTATKSEYLFRICAPFIKQPMNPLLVL